MSVENCVVNFKNDFVEHIQKTADFINTNGGFASMDANELLNIVKQSKTPGSAVNKIREQMGIIAHTQDGAFIETALRRIETNIDTLYSYNK